MVTRTIVLGPAFDNLADDTEETLAGSTFHQEAIADAYICLKRHRNRRQLPWFIGYWATLVIPREGDRPPYQPSPDLMIYTALGTDGQTPIPVATYGAPALVIEVLTPATALSKDLGFESPGSRLRAHAAIGVAEYLIFDPFADFVPEQICGWRMGPRAEHVPWQMGASRRWPSALGISFAPQGRLLRVYDDAGLIVPTYEELEVLVAAQERQLAESDRQIAELDETLRRLQHGASERDP